MISIDRVNKICPDGGLGVAYAWSRVVGRRGHGSAADAISGVARANEMSSAATCKIAGTISTTSDLVTFHCEAYSS
jgi:hypothetical protein